MSVIFQISHPPIKEHEVCLQAGEYNFFRNSDLNAIFPDFDNWRSTLVAAASQHWHEPLTPVKEEVAWLHVVAGPGQGTDWHDEGLSPDDVTLVVALNTVKGGALVTKEMSYPHTDGRCVLFPSTTRHRVEPTTDAKVRVALAMLLRPTRCYQANSREAQ